MILLKSLLKEVSQPGSNEDVKNLERLKTDSNYKKEISTMMKALQSNAKFTNVFTGGVAEAARKKLSLLSLAIVLSGMGMRAEDIAKKTPEEAQQVAQNVQSRMKEFDAAVATLPKVDANTKASVVVKDIRAPLADVQFLTNAVLTTNGYNDVSGDGTRWERGISWKYEPKIKAFGELVKLVGTVLSSKGVGIRPPKEDPEKVKLVIVVNYNKIGDIGCRLTMSQKVLAKMSRGDPKEVDIQRKDTKKHQELEFMINGIKNEAENR